MKMSYQISRQHLSRILIATINNPLAIDKIFNVYGGQDLELSSTDIERAFQDFR